VSREDKKEIGASILSLCFLSYDIWLLSSEPMHLGVLRVLTLLSSLYTLANVS
jgi:hypothetical protein